MIFDYLAEVQERMGGYVQGRIPECSVLRIFLDLEML
jgi:hypothetical protein